MPHHATPASFQPGNKAALGNDKTQRLSTWIDKQLDKPAPTDLKGYEEGMTLRQLLAAQVVDTAVTTKDPNMKLAYVKEIADRTEGKPVQALEHSGADGGPIEVTSLTNAELADIIRKAQS